MEQRLELCWKLEQRLELCLETGADCGLCEKVEQRLELCSKPRDLEGEREMLGKIGTCELCVLRERKNVTY